ncbi:MAG: hypothetical protein GY761_16430 [Hyphomicrobiales bacterium]|nr:hypothetical protein [Hyphomicrobiales bacterium]
MNIPLTTELELEFLCKEARALKRVSEWEKGLEIQARFDKQRKRQTRLFNRDKDERIEMAAQGIAKQKGFILDNLKKRRDPRGKHLVNQFERYAERLAMKDHRRRVHHINLNEVKELSVLIETSQKRDSEERENTQALETLQLPKLLTDDRSNPSRKNFNPKH